ncbi:hypothetical protein [Flavicella sediminum]|uniref:hypothetical protein n=1 Tax=Flavicella sediminum TaxID=2585141 RepID=UPI002938EF3C|nr:hypothetical protein [Flavicella sediminum]
MLSYTVPALGEFSDLIWAPISALLMTQFYKGTKGKIGAIISFTEEILPFDFIPSFTLLWIYTYFIGKEKQ